MREFTLLYLRFKLYVSWTANCSRPQDGRLRLKTYGQPYAPLQNIAVPLLI